jgi:hypothetical protein
VRARAAFLAVLLFAGLARAQDDVAAAREAMERGTKALAAGEAEAALADFKRAGELLPDANIPHRYAADALEKLGRWSEAAGELETYLKIRPWVKDADDVRARIAKIRAEHLEGRLDVLCEPDGAEVRIDESQDKVGTCPTRGVPVGAGEHVVHLHAIGYKDFELHATVPGGGVVVVHGRLEAQPVTLHARLLLEDPPPAPEASRGGITSKWWFWAGVGVVAAAATTTAVVLATKRQAPPSSDGGAHAFP